MAFTYKFSRKSKKDHTEKEKSSSQDDFFPLLFGEETEEESLSAAKQKPTEAESQPEEALSSTEETAVEENHISTEETAKEQEDVRPEDTRAFSLSDLAKENEEKANFDTQEISVEAEKTRTIPEDLIRALSENHADEKKLDEVFSKTGGAIGSETSKEEYDRITGILKEVFGSEDTKKKDEKDTDPAAPKTKTLQEALQQAREQDGEENGEYIAIHDSQEESTKEYHATFSFEKELGQMEADEASQAVPPVADEVQVPDHDNPYSDTYDEFEEKREKRAVLPEEFTSPEEYDEFAEHLRNRNFKTVVSCAWSMLAFLLVLYLESATFSRIYHPEFLKPGGIYNMIYLLVDIQAILISSLLVLSSLGDGFKGIFTGKPNRHSFSAMVTLVALVHSVAMLALGATRYPLFGVVASLFHLFSAFSNSLEAKRIYRTFRMFARRGDKLVAQELSQDTPEAEAFRDQLEGEPKFYSVQKAGFIDGFFAKVEAPSRKEKAFGVALALSFLLSLAFAGFSYWKEPSLDQAFTRFATMAVMTLPLSGIMTVVLPFSHLSKKAEKKDCAILSAQSAAEHAACDVVSFTDREIFPPKSVKITTIRTYGQTRIDKAILYGAMIFQKLGGPLSLVFKKTISGVCSEIPENFDFLEITADGMCAKIDGKSIFVGNKNYLLSYDFGYTKDEIDESFEQNSGKIMYMVIGNELAAKFYIRYSISKRFQKTILSLFKSGICPAVKTCDPNIDSDLFRTLLDNDKIPAGIIKTSDAMKDAPVMERCESGVVCTSSIANLLYGFSLSDALCHLIGANVVIKILSLLVGAGIVLFLFFIENLTKISGLFVLIYQILWMIPVIIPSVSE